MAITVVEDYLSEYGLRVMHAVDFSAPVCKADLEALVPFEGRELATYYPGVDEELKMHHLYVAWHAREVVDLSCWGSFEARYAVLWCIGKGESVSVSIELAIDIYLKAIGVMPQCVWLRKMLKDYPEVYETDRGDEAYALRLIEDERVPERFIVLGIAENVCTVKLVDGKYTVERR